MVVNTARVGRWSRLVQDKGGGEGGGVVGREVGAAQVMSQRAGTRSFPPSSSPSSATFSGFIRHSADPPRRLPPVCNDTPRGGSWISSF